MKIISYITRANFKLNIPIFSRISLSLLFVLIEIFLFPKITLASPINEEKIIELTNLVRQEYKVKPLTANQLLSKAAYEKCQDILKEQTFQHNMGDKKFSDWIKQAGYKYSFVGENLAIDFVTSEGAIKAWLNSPTHKKNIINDKFEEIGVAAMEGNFLDHNTTVIVQIFGTQLKNYAHENNEGCLSAQGDDSIITEALSSDENLSKIISDQSSCFIYDNELICKAENDNSFIASVQNNSLTINSLFNEQKNNSLLLKSFNDKNLQFSTFNFSNLLINYLFSILTVVIIVYISLDRKMSYRIKKLLLYYRKNNNIITARINR